MPFRNAHFLAVAVSWAEVLGATSIYVGAVAQDSSGYPDCRPEYYQAFNRLVQAGTKEGNIRVHTPLIALRKVEIVKLGLELKRALRANMVLLQPGRSCLRRLRELRPASARL